MCILHTFSNEKKSLWSIIDKSNCKVMKTSKRWIPAVHVDCGVTRSPRTPRYYGSQDSQLLHQQSILVYFILNKTELPAFGYKEIIFMLQNLFLQHIVFPPFIYFKNVFFPNHLQWPRYLMYEDPTQYGRSLGVIVYFCTLVILQGHGQGHSIKFKVKFLKFS